MKKFYLGLIALLVSATLFAAPRTVEEAAEIAASFSNGQPQFSRMHKAPHKAANVRLAHKVAKPNSTEDAFYVFNQDNGFVIVSADDNTTTILGYSDESTFDATNIPSNIQYWLDYTAERVAAASQATTKIKKARRATQATAIAPLLGNIKWNQGTPYNNLCPMDKTTRAYTGCVATAAAQIMKMYNWPVTGQGEHTDNWTSDAGKSGTSYANFGETTYDWANMLDSYKGSYTDAQANAVAKLMFHVGVACDMQFGGDESNGSGAYTNVMGDALVSYFRYKNTLKYKSGQSTSQLTTLFNTELEAGRPILMGGSTTKNEGHEFVCDGRDADGYFHINWGWGGTSNGYFALTALDPDEQGAGGAASGNGFSKSIDCVIGIEPDKAPVSVTSVSVTPTAITLKIKESQQLTATIAPADASNKAVSWSSSDESIAKVSASGVVVGVSAGNATITAKTNDGNKTSSCAVTVSDEVAEATLLNVDKGYAEYDDQYEEPWTVYVYNSTTSGNIPYIAFYPTGTSTNSITGAYTLGSNGGALWNDPNDTENSYVKITGGQLVITCTAKGSNGCNTYRILSYFTCEDGVEYKVDATMEICAEDADENAIELSGDKVGDGAAYEITWLAKGETFAANIAVDGKITVPADKPGKCESGKVFVGWCKEENYDSSDAPTFAKTGDAVTANTTFYAVYATVEGGSTAVNDQLTLSTTGVSGTSYTNWSGKKVNTAVYAGNSAGGNSSIQLRSNNSNSGIITTTSGGKVSKVTVEWNSSTVADRTLEVYGKNSAYSAASDLYGSNAGTKLGSIVKGTSTELNIDGDYEYVGVRSSDGAMYLTSITFTWGGANYTDYTTTCGAPAPKYAINITAAQNGSFATTPANEAAEGKTVTIKATPATHYHLASVTVKEASNATVAVSGEGNTRTFVMPAKAVTISGTFEQDDKVTVRFINNGETVSTAEYFPGESAVAPADPTPACEKYTFEGWAKEAVATETETKPTLFTSFVVSTAQDYYAIYSRTEQGAGGEAAFDGINGGTFKIYAQVGETKYYAKGVEALTSNNKKVTSTTDESEAFEYVFTKVEGGFTIKHGEKYLTYGSSGTNITEGNNAYAWNIVTGSAGSWRVNATSGTKRALAFSAGTATNVFGGYSTDNIGKTVSDATYYDLEIGGGAPAAKTYYSSVVDCTATAIDNNVVAPKAIKVIENGQIVIIRGNEKYTIFGQKIQ